MVLFKRLVMLIIGLLLTLGVGEFIASNRSPINLQFLSYTTSDKPLYMVILLSFVAGILIVGMMGMSEFIRLHLKLSKLKKAAKKQSLSDLSSENLQDHSDKKN